MNKKWFASAAIKGSGFEELADITIEFSEITSELLKNTDLLFVKNKNEFFSKFRFNGFTVISDIEIPVEEQSRFLLLSPGETFLSRTGHDIINLLTPFEHFEYLEQDMITERVQNGIRFGRQINTIGHLIQNTKIKNCTLYDFDDFAQTVQDTCRKSSIDLKFTKTGADRIDRIPDKVIMTPVIDETVLNWKMHGKSGFEIEIVNEKELVFKNTFDGSLASERAKARLRCPFMKRLNSPGNGLGLFIVSLSSVAGGFDWDISVKGNQFCLSLLF